MTSYILIRHLANEFATYGRLYDASDLSHHLWVTLERPWVDANEDGHRDVGQSRFKPGTYKLFLRESHDHGGTGKRHYDVWEFADVPDTENAQVHIANLPDELQGCVAIGLAFGPVQREGKDARPLPGIIGSKVAHGQWLQRNAGQSEVWIEVRDQF